METHGPEEYVMNENRMLRVHLGRFIRRHSSGYNLYQLKMMTLEELLKTALKVEQYNRLKLSSEEEIT